MTILSPGLHQHLQAIHVGYCPPSKLHGITIGCSAHGAPLQARVVLKVHRPA